MEIFAPLRTDTNNKLSSEEKAFPVRLEKAAKWSINCVFTSVGSSSFCFKYVIQASVVIVKPSGTGSPSLFISERLAPLPPSKSFIAIFPSLNA